MQGNKGGVQLIRYKVDEYTVKEKGREYSVLVFPFVKYMWVFDDGFYGKLTCCVDGCKEAFLMLKYAMAILTEASNKIIYFPCKQNGIGRYYNESYNLILCTPKAQLRHSSWTAIRRKLNNANKKGSYVLHYNRSKLDDFYEKKMTELSGYSGMQELCLRSEIDKEIKKKHYDKIMGENYFSVLGKEECYYNHYQISKDLDRYNPDDDIGRWTAMGYILTEKILQDMEAEVEQVTK